jgi:hypothetical protein
MNEFALYPNIYATGPSKGLLNLLEQAWIRKHTPGDGAFYIVSGFANYNGGVRFYPTFKEHTERGGKIVAFLGGSTSQRLSSQQVVEALLECGAEVTLVNRKRIMHAKCYGASNSQGQNLIVTSGNFTGPGMSQNVEAALMLDNETTIGLKFSWTDMISQIETQAWDLYRPSLTDRTSPAWQLLYDETVGIIKLDETQEITLIMTLGHSDTARIQAKPGDKAGLGSQYFWLSRDSYDFFPPLTIRNKRGYKGTFSAIVTLHYVGLGITDEECRVTFEAENNLDFRLGTGKLRYTKLAAPGDLAVISRIGEAEYQLRIIKQDTPEYQVLGPYAINFIGHQGKKYGYLSNQKVGIRLPSR